MKRKIKYLLVGVITVTVLLYFGARISFHNGKDPSLVRVANCQFIRMSTQLIDNTEFWNNSYDIKPWYLLIDLEKASCNSKLVIIDSKLYDFTGAEILLNTSPDGVKYLSRVKGLSEEFISLPPGFNKQIVTKKIE